MSRWTATTGGHLDILPGERRGRPAGPWRAGRIQAVGEVTLWNRERVRAELRAAPDLEDGALLTALIAARGPAGLTHANGAFTIAVAEPDGALLLARDAIGERTAFRARSSTGGWAASSSLRACVAAAALTPRVSLDAVAAFLTFAYVPGEDTLIQGVRELLPGRWVCLKPDGSETEDAWWQPSDGRVMPAPDADAFRAVLEQAVRRRLPGPGRKTAVLLSGGIDSSAVTALAASLHDAPVETWSISFGPELPSERGFAELVAHHCSTEHAQLVVTGTDIAERLSDAMALLDDPVGDPLTVPNLLLDEQIAAGGHDALLNGEGGDPVLGGPKNLPMLVHAIAGDGTPLSDAYLRSYRKLGDRLGDLLTPEAQQELLPLNRHVAPFLDGDGPLLHRLLLTNLRTKGAHHILPKVDRLTASAGLEGRSPLFDRDVVDAAFSTPPAAKLSGRCEKAILKHAVAELLPPLIVERPKSGMRVPVQAWLDGPLYELSREVLLGQRLRDRGILRQEPIRAWLRREGTLWPRHGQALWLCLSLELWLRAFVDAPEP